MDELSGSGGRSATLDKCSGFLLALAQTAVATGGRAPVSRVRCVARRLLWASLALAPATLLVDRLGHPDETLLFVLSALALVPLAWLIGEATEHAAEHTGPGIGG